MIFFSKPLFLAPSFRKSLTPSMAVSEKHLPLALALKAFPVDETGLRLLKEGATTTPAPP